MARPRNCIYCDAPATSKEHVIPRWIPKHFGLRREVMTHERAVGVERRAVVPFGDYAATIYCNPCHRWVNQYIENNQTRELLKAVFPGTALVLDQVGQARLATWAVKTAYADWGKQFKTRGVPISHRRYVRANGRPPADVWVSLSRCRGDRIRIRTVRWRVTPSDGSRHFWTYEFNFAIGQVAFKVWSPTMPLKDLAYKRLTTQAARIWPLEGQTARWPPGRLLDDEGLDRLWSLNPRANRI